MRATQVSVSFIDSRTIELRLELGDVRHAMPGGPPPADGVTDPDQGWVWHDGRWSGRIGTDGVWMPTDRYVASPLDRLFEAGGRADRPDAWSVSIGGQAVDIAGLSRKASILETAETGWFTFDFATVQTVFLELADPMRPGDEVSLDFDHRGWAPATARFDPRGTLSEAIHVNLVGFDPDDGLKTAFLSTWKGAAPDGVAGGGGHDFDGPRGFRLVDEDTGRVMFRGETVLRASEADPTGFKPNFAGADVWAMDFSAFEGAGRFFVEVQGVGRSQSFDIAEGHWDALFDTAFSGFFHQRSGIALTAEHTEWTHPRSLHPADGRITVYETTVKLMDTGEGYDSSLTTPFDLFPDATTGEILPRAWGGWHDAGDWDRRTQHIEAARKLVELVELAPDWAATAGGSLPESGNRLPDLLDEAIWGLAVFARLQTDEGGVRGGIEGSSYAGYGASSWTETGAFYAYAPDVWTSWEFAAAAAKLSGAIRPFNERAADLWLGRADDAMAWAEATLPRGDWDPVLVTSRNLAAVELYRATGDEAWHDLFLRTSSYRDPGEAIDWRQTQYEAAFVYATMDPAMTRAGVAARTEAAILDQAEFLLTEGDSPFGALIDPYPPYGWGNTAQQPSAAADFMARAHHLTGEDRWLDAMMADLQYAMGANPLNTAFLTGNDGVRTPRSILNGDADAMGGKVTPGIALYGDHSIFDYGEGFYHDVMRDAVNPSYYDAPVHESFHAFSLFVPSTEYTVQQGITDMTFATGYLAARADADLL